MQLGIDISTFDELAELNPVYRYHGQVIEPLSFFRQHSGISLVRIRIWNDPFDEKGRPYGGGTTDLAAFLRSAKKAQSLGYGILLDFHYSDFWADPGKQTTPKAWTGKSYPEVVKALYEYTRDTLLTVKREGIALAGIQVGNEITHGMVWPYGALDREFDPETGGGFEGLSGLLKAGVAACREVYPEAKVLLHLEHSGSYEMQEPWLYNVTKNGVDFDVIGQSYYPFWHGSLEGFRYNNERLQKEYGKPVWVVELGYAFGSSPYEEEHKDLTNLIDDNFVATTPSDRVPFPLTKQGQADYLRAFLGVAKSIGVEAVFYWEPMWIGIEGAGWAKQAGMEYTGEVGKPALNEWANETLFDFEGEATPGLDSFTQSVVDSL